jgi:hypothetical protein
MLPPKRDMQVLSILPTINQGSEGINDDQAGGKDAHDTGKNLTGKLSEQVEVDLQSDEEKTMEFTRKAAYSQKELTASLVVALMCE